MENLTPSEVIQFRAECYSMGDGRGVFSLYAERSDMCRLFTEDSFDEHFTRQVKNSMHAGLKIIDENVKSNLAEVKYIEYIHDEGMLLTYYSKTSMVKEENRWKILKEIREIKKHPMEVAD